MSQDHTRLPPTRGEGQGLTQRSLSLKSMFFGSAPLAVARSLRDEPSRWSGYFHRGLGLYLELRHASGVVLWTGNAAYGMEATDPEGGKWGGVTGLSTFGLSPGHWLLRAAADRWIRANPQPLPARQSIVAALTQPHPPGGNSHEG